MHKLAAEVAILRPPGGAVQVTDSTKFSLHLAWGGCNVMPSGWHNWLSVKLKRVKGFERNLSSLSLLSSSAVLQLEVRHPSKKSRGAKGRRASRCCTPCRAV